MWNATRYDDPDLLSNVIVVRPILLLYIQLLELLRLFFCP